MSREGAGRVLVVELWGLGDGVLMTSALRALRARDRAASVLCAPPVAELLAPRHPDVEFLPFRFPWTAFRAKYRLWRWPWRELARLLRMLRARRFDAALSVRPDPRDHLLMWAAGARVRCGFPRAGSGVLLNRPVPSGTGLRHRVEDWNELIRALEDCALPLEPPCLRETVDLQGPCRGTPIVALHCGAAQPVRRWSVDHWRELMTRLRERYAFTLWLIPDLDGYGSELAEEADRVVSRVSLEGLVETLAEASLFLGNDSGPAHVAAALGVPTVAIFGPQHPERFAPFGSHARAVARNLCRYRGCSDRCRYPEPRCLTKLTAGEVARDVTEHVEGLLARGALTDSLRRGPRTERRAG